PAADIVARRDDLGGQRSRALNQGHRTGSREGPTGHAVIDGPREHRTTKPAVLHTPNEVIAGADDHRNRHCLSFRPLVGNTGIGLPVTFNRRTSRRTDAGDASPRATSGTSYDAPLVPYTPRQSDQPRFQRARIFTFMLDVSKSQSCRTFGRSRQ